MFLSLTILHHLGEGDRTRPLEKKIFQPVVPCRENVADDIVERYPSRFSWSPTTALLLPPLLFYLRG